jgi:hypothetical protein
MHLHRVRSKTQWTPAKLIGLSLGTVFDRDADTIIRQQPNESLYRGMRMVMVVDRTMPVVHAMVSYALAT